MGKKITIESTQLLVVEGKDECSFFEAILKYENINNIQVIDIGGKDKFKFELPALLNLEGFSKVHTLGFVRDAEENQADSAFSSICDTLKENGLPVPKAVNTIVDVNNIKLSIFIMPNNIDEGMLEDLCIQSVKQETVFKCVDKYIECCQMYSLDVKNIKISKAKIQTYLAIKNPIVNSLGLAALKGYWDFSENCFSEIKQFLHILFSCDK